MLAAGGLVVAGAATGAAAAAAGANRPTGGRSGVGTEGGGGSLRNAALTPATARLTPKPRQPGQLFFPDRPMGTDQIPEIEHIVVVMMENHSFDNILGMLGRGDGFTLGPQGRPTNWNPNGHGGRLRAFHMPTPCQLQHKPSQSWNASHAQFEGGKLEGFVTSASGPVAMGYFTPKDMPFTNSLARTFPLADRWFCSLLGQTYPNRRYLLAGTSLGMINDTFDMALPPNGTILEHFHANRISWKNYFFSPKGTPSVYVWMGLLGKKWVVDGTVPIGRFFSDANKGALPAFSLVDPNFTKSSEENPQDVQFGDVFLSKVVQAVMHGPKWRETLLIWCYDEHGGYYDHVVPPPAPVPDDVPPDLTKGDVKASFDQYGFRVPAGVVSAYAKKGYVSPVVFDHTSILALVEQKWNLPALTKRDAAAKAPLDMLAFSAPAFAQPPRLAAPADPARRAGCLLTGPGKIP